MTSVWNDDLPSHERVRPDTGTASPFPAATFIPLIDLGEPECFACGWCRLEQVRSRAAQQDIWKGLERAHVVARSLGGLDNVENLALLCKPCHEHSPDTADPAIFWRWVINHPKNGSMAHLFKMRDFKDLRATDYRGPLSNVLRGLGSLKDDELTFLMTRYEEDPSSMLQGLHEAQRRIGGITTHWGVGLSSGTVEALLREIVRHERARTAEGPDQVSAGDLGR